MPVRRTSVLLGVAPYVPIPTQDTEDGGSDEEDQEGEETWRAWGERLLQRPAYQISSATLILANAIVVGLETDLHSWPWWDEIENFFLFCFTIELALRLIVITPQRFFRTKGNPEFTWNVFDLVIVSVGVIDFVGTLVSSREANEFKGNKASMKFALVFRIVRLCRILRVLRIIRFMRQLYLLAYGFVEATLAIFWVTILMTCVLYVCGIILVRIYGQVPQDDPDHAFLTAHFGSVPGSMLSLFELMSQPDIQEYEVVLENRPSLLPFLVCFIIFGSFGMIALLTGVISESMFEKNKARIEEAQLEREQRRNRLQKDCRKVFDGMQADDMGSVSKEELSKHKTKVRHLLEMGGVDLSGFDLDELYNALDTDASGKVDCLEFENGIVQMCEDVRPLSIMELHHCIRKCHLLVEDCNRILVDRLEDVDIKLDDLGFQVTALSTKLPASAKTRPLSAALPTLQVPQLDGTATRSVALESMAPTLSVPSSPKPLSRVVSVRSMSRSPRVPPSAYTYGASSHEGSPRVTARRRAANANAGSHSQPLEVVRRPSIGSGGALVVPGQSPQSRYPPGCKEALLASDRSGAESFPASAPDNGEKWERQTTGAGSVRFPAAEEEHPPSSEPGVVDLTLAQEEEEVSSPILADFKTRLEELAQQVRGEMQQIEEASSRLGRLLALQAEQAARLEGSSVLQQAALAALAECAASKAAAPLPADELPPETAVEMETPQEVAEGDSPP